jgi:hypothetical protein
MIGLKQKVGKRRRNRTLIFILFQNSFSSRIFMTFFEQVVEKQDENLQIYSRSVPEQLSL